MERGRNPDSGAHGAWVFPGNSLRFLGGVSQAVTQLFARVADHEIEECAGDLECLLFVYFLFRAVLVSAHFVPHRFTQAFKADFIYCHSLILICRAAI